MLNTRGFGLSVLMVLAMVLVAVPVLAAPGAGLATAAGCTIQRAAHPLGVDGGLTALRTGELTVQSARSLRPSGVDGGLTSLLFARSEVSNFTAYAAVACGSALTGS